MDHEGEIKITTSPQICCRTTLRKVSVQLCSRINSNKTDTNISIHDGREFPVYTQINLQYVFKMSSLACFESCTPMDNECADYALFNAMSNVHTYN